MALGSLSSSFSVTGDLCTAAVVVVVVVIPVDVSLIASAAPVAGLATVVVVDDMWAVGHEETGCGREEAVVLGFAGSLAVAHMTHTDASWSL